jgi:hypothetical protein
MFPFVFALLAAAPPATATPAPRAVAAATAVQAAAVKLDGDPSDDVWSRAPVITGFKQRDPDETAPPTFDTEVRVAYDATAIYVAVQAVDREPARIVGIRTRRDEDSPSDWIRVMFDSFRDRRTAYEFAVNPAGVKQDVYWFNDSNTDRSWDAVWDVAVARNDRGWHAEFRIPFSQLRFHPVNPATFGFAVVRKIGRLNETTTWPLLSKSANGYVSSFGELTGLELGRSPKRLELVPYVVGDVTTQPSSEGNPLLQPTDPDAALGLDLKYALAPGLTLTGTVNPDFGQVEADPAVVNLSAFETFFAERRPFFVEGSGNFRFDVDCSDGVCSGLFYSRRIGRTPRGAPDVQEGAYYDAPLQTTILGAAKLTGRVGAYSIGVMNAITADEDAVIASGNVETRQTVEPLTGYTVARARREFADQSTLGFIATATNRTLDEATRFLPSQAYTGGVDWDWRLGRRYALQGNVAFSSVRGDAEAIDNLQRSNVHSFQRPDADYVTYDPLSTELNGYGAQLSISKIAGERTRFTSIVATKSPGLDFNDVGFMRRADQRTVSNWIQFRHDTPRGILRSFRWNLNQYAGWNYGGDMLHSGGNVNAHATFTSNWSTGMGINLNAAGFDDRATRGGPGALGTPERGVWAYVDSDNRKAVSVGLNGSIWADNQDSGSADINPYVSWRPTSFLTVGGGLRLSRNRQQSQWIEQDGDHYVFGLLEQRTAAITARVNYTITPALTIQLYAEPFVSSGDYSNFKELVDGRAPDYEDRYRPYAYGGNPDFNYRSFRTTNVMRWEYRPGSTVFVVWQQGREDTLQHGDFQFSRDLGGVFDAPARNIFLVKWAYWLNF